MQKVEDILVAKGVRVTVPHVYTREDGAELHLRWNHLTRRIQIDVGYEHEEGTTWENVTSLCDSASENATHIPAAIVAQEITRLMPACLEEQAAFERDCLTGAALLATYIQEVGWFNKTLDPVEAVEPTNTEN